MMRPKKEHVCKVYDCGLQLVSRKNLRRHYVCKHRMGLLDGQDTPYKLDEQEYQEKMDVIKRGQAHPYICVQEQRRRAREREQTRDDVEEDGEPPNVPLITLQTPTMWEKFPEAWAKSLAAPEANLSDCQVSQSSSPIPIEQLCRKYTSSSDSIAIDIPNDCEMDEEEELPTLDFDGSLPQSSRPQEIRVSASQDGAKRTVVNLELPIFRGPPGPSSYKPKPGGYWYDTVFGGVTPTDSEMEDEMIPDNDVRAPARDRRQVLRKQKGDPLGEMEVGDCGSGPSSFTGERGGGLDQPLAPADFSFLPSDFDQIMNQSEAEMLDEIASFHYESEVRTTLEEEQEREQAKARLIARHLAVKSARPPYVNPSSTTIRPSMSTDTDDLMSPPCDASVETDRIITKDQGDQTDGSIPELSSFEIRDNMVRINYPCGVDPTFIIKLIRRNPKASAHDVVALAQHLRKPKVSELRDIYLLADGAVRMARYMAQEISTFQNNKSVSSIESFEINDANIKKLLNDEKNRPPVPQGLGVFGFLPAVRPPSSGETPSFHEPGPFNFRPRSEPFYPSSTPRNPYPATGEYPPGFKEPHVRYHRYPRPSASQSSASSSQDLFESSDRANRNRRRTRRGTPEQPSSPVIIPDDDEDEVIPATQPVYEDISSD